MRPLERSDNLILGQYFLNLSEHTRSLYGPHPFDQATADQFCENINYADTIRMIATVSEGAGEQVIAYFILQLGIPKDETQRYVKAGILLEPHLDCLIAPCVADAYQNHGLGTPLMRQVFEVACSLGRRYIVLMGGVYVTNDRAVHYYQKLGFKNIGSFEPSWPNGRTSYDMYLEL